MPINKVNVVHKFGIISQSQRQKLQQRLIAQSIASTLMSKKTLIQRNPLEVTDEFVLEFNNAPDLEEQDRLEALAKKMIERIKRRAGLRAGGLGMHVDLPIAWTELAQLAQCKGPIQEECLDVLITSLDQGPLEENHIPALFYLAETTLYWLRTEAIHQPCLRTGELKLLRMGQLVFTRLFYHHMAGQLQGQRDFKKRLYTYLDGFSDSQEAYAPYPNALLSMRYINEVGKMIIGDVTADHLEFKDGDSICETDGNSSEWDQPQAFTRLPGNVDHDCMSKDRAEELVNDKSREPDTISSNVHDLSPTLWHALDVWRCVHKPDLGIESAFRSLGNCGMRLASESWIDGIGGMLILADCAKKLLQPLRVMQNLARGVRPCLKDYQTEDDLGFLKTGEFGTTAETLPTNLPNSQGDPSAAEHSPNAHPAEPAAASSPAGAGAGAEAGLLLDERDSPELGPVPNTGMYAEADTDVSGGRTSQASNTPTFTNEAIPELPGINGWHWEVAITYTECLTDICLYGVTSNIQKVALVGNNKDVDNIYRAASMPAYPLPSAGLLDLVFFYAKNEAHDHGPNDWSWRVRYSAIQGLMKLCRCTAMDHNRDGLRTVAWNTLLKARSLEKDIRVLEALRIGQVGDSIENLQRDDVSISPSTLGEKMAAGLSQLYLPPLPPLVEVASQHRPWHDSRVTVGQSRVTPRRTPRTSLGQEIMLASATYEPPINFETRTGFDLRRIVEDQWRKELQLQLEEEEVERQKQLADKQKAEEKADIRKMTKGRHFVKLDTKKPQEASDTKAQQEGSPKKMHGEGLALHTKEAK